MSRQLHYRELDNINKKHTAVEIDIMHFGGVIMGLDTQSTNPIDYGSNIIIMQIRRE